MNRNLMEKVQKLGRKVEPIRQFVQNAPAEMARIREAVAVTAGQLQQLRSEIQAGLGDLRADSGDQMLAALNELRGASGVLRQAGFEFAGVDLELGVTAGQRLMIQLRRVEVVPPAMLRALASAYPGNLVLRAVLAALERAIQMAETVDLRELDFTQLTVALGPAPSVRIGWRSESGSKGSAIAGALQAAAVPDAPESSRSTEGKTPALPAASVLPPFLGSKPPEQPASPAPAAAVAPSLLAPFARPAGGAEQGGLQTSQGSAVPAVPSPEPKPVEAPLPAPTPPPVTIGKNLGSNWRENALERFKKMPRVGTDRSDRSD